MDTFFSDYFEIPPKAIARYGAFNISLVADLPLFVDPFLLFNSRKRIYHRLHGQIIEYLRFLKEKSLTTPMTPGLIDAWYRFPEVRQIWLGFSAEGNRGSGLGKQFATALHENLQKVFSDFGTEKVTKGSHLEKLCLIKDHVGRDNISDFTTNLIREFLLEYTQTFAKDNIRPELRRKVRVSKVRFNYKTETWESGIYDLPWFKDDYVLLTPKNILTKDDTWINKTDLIEQFEDIADSIPNQQLRAQLSNYFRKILPRHAKKKDEERAAADTIMRFPEFVDHYIRYKEEHGDQAESISTQKVSFSHKLYVQQFSELAALLLRATGFYALNGTTYAEAHARVAFLKDVIENKGGHRLFFVNGHPIEREEDLQILFRLTWYSTDSDVSREVNDGRGPVDFKISKGNADKTLVEFKLAKNSQLKRNLEKQTQVYEKASDTHRSIKVIIYFSKQELNRVNKILKDLGLSEDKDVILIDARSDNKPSGSKA